MHSRRRFLYDFSLGVTAWSSLADISMAQTTSAQNMEPLSFFLVGDTHYAADVSDSSKMDEDSQACNIRLIEWLNRLPGTSFSEATGGQRIAIPHGVIHAGDLIDNGDKGAAKYPQARTEIAAFMADYGLHGGDGKLKWPVREVHGNHDSPHGDGPVIPLLMERNRNRRNLALISNNGLHYSWDWAGVHFVALGLIVGETKSCTRKRRYAALESLAFLQQDLAQSVGDSKRPVILVNHVDVHRYAKECAIDQVLNHEWDFADVQAFYAVIKPYRIAAMLCGHTHVRKIARWDGSGNDRVETGIPFLNTDNSAHFNSETQGFLHIEMNNHLLSVREFVTKDAWLTGVWTPQVWNFALT
jgi:Calcineurin-like phosphoesterase